MSETDVDKYDLWQHPNGRWYIVWPGEQGTRRISTGRKDEREARKHLNRFKARKLSGEKPESVTVAAVLDGYLKEREGKVRAHDTLKFACKALKKHLGDLDPAHLDDAQMEDYADKRERAAGTIIREIVTLRAALRWARRKKWIASVPDLPMPVSTPQPKDRWLTKDEARKLIASCATPHVRLFILLGLKTAARTGAIMELKWDQVDMEARLIDYGKGHGNKRRATVPMDAQLYEALREAQELACTAYVIEYNGQRVESIRTAFRRACERAGLKGVGRHTLRHTAATWAVMGGAPLSKVARLLGDSEKMVEKVYGKHSPDYLRDAIVTLGL